MLVTGVVALFIRTAQKGHATGSVSSYIDSIIACRYHGATAVLQCGALWGCGYGALTLLGLWQRKVRS